MGMSQTCRGNAVTTAAKALGTHTLRARKDSACRRVAVTCLSIVPNQNHTCERVKV